MTRIPETRDDTWADMVAALKAVLAQQRTDDKSVVYTPALVAQVRAAISKAEGRS